MNKRLQLFILPFAGGDSNSFNRLLPFIDPLIDVHVIEYAGRLSRRKEGYIEDYNAFLLDVASQINRIRNNDCSYAIMGYSLGSVLTYDLCVNNLINGSLVHVFICSKGSLHNKTNVEKSSGYTDDEVIDEIKYLGGTDDRLLNNTRFSAIFLEPVKMDFNIWRQYVYHPGKILCDASMIYSRYDPAAAGVHDWDVNVAGNTEYFEMGKNHFFIKEYYKEVSEIINNNLKKHL